jgi:phosphotriesterase-related protein
MSEEKYIQTALGPIRPEDFGTALVHEHLLVDFIGAKDFSKDRYDIDQVVGKMLPYLLEVKKQGVSSFVECTPMYLGRDPVLARRLSEMSGLHILVNTGLYAAGERESSPEPYLPEYAYRLSAEVLAGGWVKEWFEGIEGTAVRPGFIKIGVNSGTLRPISEKVVRAAAVTSRHTGLLIACHTVKGVGALRILEILEEEGVPGERFCYVHAQGEENFEFHLLCAQRGAWLEYDGVGPDSAEKHLDFVTRMLEAGFEDQILVSQDAGWYRPGEPDGGKVRGFSYLLSDFVPRMLNSGIPEASVNHLLVHNPARAFAIRTATG